MAFLAGYLSKFYVVSLPAVSFTNEAMTDDGTHTIYTITNSAKRYLTLDDAVSVETSPDGTNWTAITTGFTLARINARVIFDTPQVAGTQVRLASGKYYPYAQFGEASSAEFAGKTDMEETTVFTTNGVKRFLPTTVSGTLKCGSWHVNRAFVDLLSNRSLIIVSFELAGGVERYEGYCYVSDSNLKSEVKGVVSEDLTFMLTNEFFVGV